MSKEGIKSIVLTLLVIFSLVLTWSIWTNSPNIDPINQVQYMEEVEISNKQEISAIVKPIQVLYHNDNNHYGSSSEEIIDNLMEIVNNWSFSDIENISANYTPQEFQNFANKAGTSEIIFADEVPLLLYKQVIKLEDSELPDIEFNRIVVKSSSDYNKTNNVYFVNTAKEYIYKTSVDGSDVKQFVEQIKKISDMFLPFSSVEIAEGKKFYLPSNELTINSYKYYTEQLDEKEFRDALFASPKLVKKINTARGQRYTDGLSRMNVYKDTMMLSYIDPTQEEKAIASSSELLERSIQFVNDHAGWEENYHFAELKSSKQKVTFRLYMNGLPVFNSNGMSEIVQVWTQDDIYSYDRPIFTLNFPVPTGTKEVKVLSGEEAVKLLVQMKDFKVDLLEDMAIGYQMSRDVNEPRLIILEPTWYFKYKGVWQPLMSVVIGGVDDGLE